MLLKIANSRNNNLADYRLCYQIMRAASKNYSFTYLLLPAEKRKHVAALYAVMRIGDDLVDLENGSVFAPHHRHITDWYRSYQLAFQQGDSPHPVLRAYIRTAAQFSIPVAALESYFGSMVADLNIQHYKTFDDLLNYMAGSAIPVGRILVVILGVLPNNHEAALLAADALSIAMQLSNFLRDIGEDWRRGRVYLPQDDMARFGYTEHDLASSRINESFKALLAYEIERAEMYYNQARQGIPLLQRGRLAVLVALEIYRAILSNIRQLDYDVFSERAGLTPLKKLNLVMQSWIQANRLDSPTIDHMHISE